MHNNEMLAKEGMNAVTNPGGRGQAGRWRPELTWSEFARRSESV
jgi:hypothetical protein